jgi:hypothetical protein
MTLQVLLRMRPSSQVITQMLPPLIRLVCPKLTPKWIPMRATRTMREPISYLDYDIFLDDERIPPMTVVLWTRNLPLMSGLTLGELLRPPSGSSWNW